MTKGESTGSHRLAAAGPASARQPCAAGGSEARRSDRSRLHPVRRRRAGIPSRRRFALVAAPLVVSAGCGVALARLAAFVAARACARMPASGGSANRRKRGVLESTLRACVGRARCRSKERAAGRRPRRRELQRLAAARALGDPERQRASVSRLHAFQASRPARTWIRPRRCVLHRHGRRRRRGRTPLRSTSCSCCPTSSGTTRWSRRGAPARQARRLGCARS